MSLQDAFYIIGIVYMGLYTILLIVVIILLFVIKKKLEEFAEKIKDALSHPRETAVKLGSKVASALINKAKERVK